MIMQSNLNPKYLFSWVTFASSHLKPSLSVKSILKTAYEAMDTHYDALATSLARYRAVNTKPSVMFLWHNHVESIVTKWYIAKTLPVCHQPWHFEVGSEHCQAIGIRRSLVPWFKTNLNNWISIWVMGPWGPFFVAVPGEARLHVQKSKPSTRPRKFWWEQCEHTCACVYIFDFIHM